MTEPAGAVTKPCPNFTDAFRRRSRSVVYLLLLVALPTGSGCKDAATVPESAAKPNEVTQQKLAEKQAAEREQAEAAEYARQIAALPPAERFVTAMKGYFESYRSAPPEHKQANFNRAREFEALFFSGINNRVVSWEGQFEAVPEPNKPSDFLRFSVPKTETFHLRLRGVDSSGNLKAPPKTSPVFKAVTKIGAGTCASVSGTINPKERSASDNGAMKEPEYDLIFEDVKPCKAQQEATNAAQTGLGALPPAQNLAAARSAMSDGYDAKKRTGGRLDDAESALNAIGTSAVEAAAAKKLLVEVGERRDRQRLDAARVALADGYDPKTGLGGDLEVADEQLKGVTNGNAESKKLSAELKARSDRATYNAKAAAFMKETGESDDTFAFQNGQLIVTTETPSMGTLRDLAISGHMKLSKLARSGFDEIPELQAITVVEMGQWDDARGNEKKAKISEFMVTRKTAKTINWDNITPRNIPKVINKAWMSPATGSFAE